MRIIITGTSGLLGSMLLDIATTEGHQSLALKRGDLQGKDLASLRQLIANYGPDVLIHCAANTNVELCELEYEKCYEDNVGLTETLLNATKDLDIKFVFISSTGIYGSYKTSPYTDFDTVKPTTHHHNSKRLAEQSINESSCQSLIVRTGWLFGGVSAQKDFVINRIHEALSSSGEIFSDITQVGNPTSVVDLSRNIMLLLEQGWTGTFNCVNHGATSRYQYVKEIIKISGLTTKVTPVDAKQFKRLAKVSNNESAVNEKLALYGIDMMPHWEQSLTMYINQLKFNNVF